MPPVVVDSVKDRLLTESLRFEWAYCWNANGVRQSRTTADEEKVRHLAELWPIEGAWIERRLVSDWVRA